MFKALLVEKDDSGLRVGIQEFEDDRLPEGNVTVAVEYSTLNYKDGLALSGASSVVKSFPHVPGVDFAGRVESSDDPRFRPGDAVILNGWRVGEFRWGGYATRTRVQGDWLIRVPEGLTTRDAMVVGTAGYTAALAIMALEEHGLAPGADEVLVTGASGGVGSIAVALLKAAGYEVAAVTGRPETESYLRDLGAARVVPRSDLDRTSERPLEREVWAGAIDNVGGAMLARLLGQMRYGASVAAVGLVGEGRSPRPSSPSS
ncbi:YhdH, a putative quinone oxidoreductase [Rubellimicrobium mesophilum DSM 19309]|uniref:YhdH, a putative quinone oxidoreductase n=1 Tax=Rubellimicrobium mesophilum DSM 19309 TaxID=442562 RepID=A0A017HPY3_9RHOB|nr:YhdH, a putative quinone oxidoreductase [Rubellimicrobium mesophilum DSM 19309]